MVLESNMESKRKFMEVVLRVNVYVDLMHGSFDIDRVNIDVEGIFTPLNVLVKLN